MLFEKGYSSIYIGVMLTFWVVLIIVLGMEGSRFTEIVTSNYNDNAICNVCFEAAAKDKDYYYEFQQVKLTPLSPFSIQSSL